MLESEGLSYRGYIDIFDGGATLEADIDQLRAVKEGRLLPVAIDETPVHADLPACLVANDDYQQYRALLVQADPDGDCLRVSAQTAAALGIFPGGKARLVTLNPRGKSNAIFFAIYQRRLATGPRRRIQQNRSAG